MGKKKREEMALHQEKFVKGAVERGIGKTRRRRYFVDGEVSDLVSLADSVAYAFRHFKRLTSRLIPRALLPAVLSSEAQDAAKVFKYSKELRAQGINSCLRM